MTLALTPGVQSHPGPVLQGPLPVWETDTAEPSELARPRHVPQQKVKRVTFSSSVECPKGTGLALLVAGSPVLGIRLA